MRLVSVILLLLLIGCSAGAAQPEPPTPTPLPPAPELERPTYRVMRADIDRVLEVSGRVTPVDLVTVSFRSDGRIAEVLVARGALVQAGELLATLAQENELAALEQADLAVAGAERDLAAARTQRDLAVAQAESRVVSANERLAHLQTGPSALERRRADDAVQDAHQALETIRRTAAADKAAAERAVAAAVDAVIAAQEAYSTTYWAAQQARGGPAEQQSFDALAAAERDLRAAERVRAQALLEQEEAQRAEIEQIQAAETQLARAERDRDRLAEDALDPAELTSARQALREANVALNAARATTFAREEQALAAARLDRAQAERLVEAGQLRAPQAGQVLTVGIRPGDEVSAFTPVFEIADPGQLEVAFEPAADQVRELTEGQAATMRLLSRPDLALPAVIRRIPAGGSGSVRAEDRNVRLTITNPQGQTLSLGAVVRVQIVLEQKDNVLVLPPEAIRSFEGRQFVIVRAGDRERRAPVRLGIQTPERVEVVEGLAEGDLVVGQ